MLREGEGDDTRMDTHENAVSDPTDMTQEENKEMQEAETMLLAKYDGDQKKAELDAAAVLMKERVVSSKDEELADDEDL